MLPLLLKDGLLVPYVVTSTGFLLLSIYLLSALDHCTEDELQLTTYRKLLFFPFKSDLGSIVRWKFYISVAAMVGLSITSVTLDPPSHLPDLFPVLVSTTAYLLFLGTIIHFNTLQFSGPASKKSQKKIN